MQFILVICIEYWAVFNFFLLYTERNIPKVNSVNKKAKFLARFLFYQIGFLKLYNVSPPLRCCHF